MNTTFQMIEGKMWTYKGPNFEHKFVYHILVN